MLAPARKAAIVALVSIIAAGCWDEDSATEPTTVDTAIALVTLPPVEAFPATITVGAWDWGPPCRVPVREVVGGSGPRVERSFTIGLEPDPGSDGFVMSFDDVTEQRRGLSEEFIAGELYRYLAVLPAMRLGPDGRFLEFVDLDGALAGLTDRASSASVEVDEPADAAGVVEAVLDRTILSWYGFWLDDSRLPLNPGRLAGDRQRAGEASIAPVTNESFAAPVTRDGVWGAASDDSVWLRYTEQPTSDLTGRVDVSAVVDRTNLRPSYVVARIEPAADDLGIGFSSQDRRVVTFHWDRAEGCV